MNKLNFYIRYPLRNISAISNQIIQVRLKSSKKPHDKSEKPNIDKAKNKDALQKLNLLLKQIVEDDEIMKSSPTLDLAKPRPKRRGAIQKQIKEDDSVKVQEVEKNIISSARNVAESLGGNAKQTESELLSKLLHPIDAGDKETIPTNLSDIIKGMRIDRSQKREDVSRAQQVKDVLAAIQDNARPFQAGQRKSPKRQIRSVKQYNDRPRDREKIDLFGKQSLGIFSDVSQYTDVKLNKTWQEMHKRELRLAVTHPPANYFQQMILWTEQGKLWKFPIDNEQGMEEEQNIYFAEHVFLERHLEPWCPPKGPIRHFMELVCVGLSKNPYMSVKHKQEHIAWFENYFHDKQKLLEETGAIPMNFKIESGNVQDDVKN